MEEAVFGFVIGRPAAVRGGRLLGQVRLPCPVLLSPYIKRRVTAAAIVLALRFVIVRSASASSRRSSSAAFLGCFVVFSTPTMVVREVDGNLVNTCGSFRRCRGCVDPQCGPPVLRR